MKKGLLIFFNLTLILFCYPQGIQHHRVSVLQSQEVIKKIHQLGLQVDFINTGNRLIMELSEQELDVLKKANIDFTLEIENLEAYYSNRNKGKNANEILEHYRNLKSYTVPENFALGSMGGFCTYNELLAHLDTMFLKFPDLITQKSALPGQTIQGRPVYWLRISDNPSVNEDEPEVFYNALIHAREPGSMQQLLYFMYYLLENYGTDNEITWLLDHTELYFVPCINPDGYIYNEQLFPAGGGMWRKNMRSNSNGSKGVDLNRNFGYMWGYNDYGSSPNPNSSTYRGVAAFSEPETQLIRNFGEDHNFKVVMNYHTYGNLLLHSWGYISYMIPLDYEQMHKIVSCITAENRWDFGTASKLLYLVNGDATDWFYGEDVTKSSSMAFTPEVGTNDDGFWPPVENIIPQCQSCLKMNVMAALMAGFYVELIDLGTVNITLPQGYLKFGIKRTGMTDNPFSVTISPITENFLFLDSVRQFNSLSQLETGSDSIFYQLIPGVLPGEQISYAITIDNDGFIFSDTITKIFGSSIVLFDDYFDNIAHWQTDAWALQNNYNVTPEFSISNVAESFYANNVQSSIVLNDTIVAHERSNIWVNFKARWDLDGGKDYVRFVMSVDDGESWKELKGRYSSMIFEESGYVPIYQGFSDAWVDEWILIPDVREIPLRFGFLFESDASFGRSGFYCDDFCIITTALQTAQQEIQIQSGWSGISTFLLPENTNIEGLFGTHFSGLSFLTDNNQFYQPGNINSNLTTWNVENGFLIKSNQAFLLNITGNVENINHIQLQQGWNLIPVMLDIPVELENLSTEPPTMIRLVKEACGVLIYWPEKGIISLDELIPGKSYFVEMKEDAVLFFQ